MTIDLSQGGRFVGLVFGSRAGEKRLVLVTLSASGEERRDEWGMPDSSFLVLGGGQA